MECIKHSWINKHSTLLECLGNGECVSCSMFSRLKSNRVVVRAAMRSSTTDISLAHQLLQNVHIIGISGPRRCCCIWHHWDSSVQRSIGKLSLLINLFRSSLGQQPDRIWLSAFYAVLQIWLHPGAPVWGRIRSLEAVVGKSCDCRPIEFRINSGCRGIMKENLGRSSVQWSGELCKVTVLELLFSLERNGIFWLRAPKCPSG